MTLGSIRTGFAAAILAGTSLAATAADLPPRQRVALPPALVSAPAYDWSGFYLGINGGWIWGNSTWTAAGRTEVDIDTSGALIGGTLGFNVQNAAWVWGFEADLGWADNDGSTGTNCTGTGCFVKNSWLGTARGRIGYAADRFMPYFTGGAAFGNVKAHFNTLPEASDTRTGWTIGGGVEYAIADNWSAKLEYLYADLGSFSCPVANCGAPGPVSADFTANVFRIGFNYKFGPVPAATPPIVTRY